MTEAISRKQKDTPKRIDCPTHSKDGYWPVEYLGFCADCLYEASKGTAATMSDIALESKQRQVPAGEGS